MLKLFVNKIWFENPTEVIFLLSAKESISKLKDRIRKIIQWLKDAGTKWTWIIYQKI